MSGTVEPTSEPRSPDEDTGCSVILWAMLIVDRSKYAIIRSLRQLVERYETDVWKEHIVEDPHHLYPVLVYPPTLQGYCGLWRLPSDSLTLEDPATGQRVFRVDVVENPHQPDSCHVLVRARHALERSAPLEREIYCSLWAMARDVPPEQAVAMRIMQLDEPQCERWVLAHLPMSERYRLHSMYYGEWYRGRLTVAVLDSSGSPDRDDPRGNSDMPLPVARLRFELVPADQTHTEIRAYSNEELGRELLEGMLIDDRDGSLGLPSSSSGFQSQPTKSTQGRSAVTPHSDSRAALSVEGQREMVLLYWKAKREGLLDTGDWDGVITRKTQEQWAKDHGLSGRTLRRYLHKHRDLEPTN